MKKSYLVIAIVLLFAATAMAADVSFRWNANTEPDLAGYRLYHKATAGVTTGDELIVDIACGPNDLACALYTQTGVPDGPHFWILTAYDQSGNESLPSVEQDRLIDKTPPAPPTWLELLISWIKSWWGKGFRIG